MADRVLALLAFALAFSSTGSALTVKSRSDLRYWETVTDRSAPLSWIWEPTADAAVLTFTDRLKGKTTTETVVRAVGASYGSCAHPVVADDVLMSVTLVQKSGGSEIARENAELAYVSGVAGRAFTVRTRSEDEWWRVGHPRFAGFDARWWNVSGSSGYEVLWAKPTGWHRVTRDFAGVGTVDVARLYFGIPGYTLFIR